MPDTAMEATDLKPFEGIEVIRTGIEIPGAAGGLRESMKIAPQELHRGDKVFIVLECGVEKVRHDPVKVPDDEEPAWCRVHILSTTGAVIVDEDLVRVQLDTMKARIAEAKAEEQRAKEKAAGIQRLTEDTAGKCPFPGCPLDEDHEGDHGHDPSSGVAAPGDPTPTLKKLTKPQLRSLCDAHEIVYTEKATGAELVAMLVGVPGITAEALELRNAGKAPDNVVPIAGTGTDD